LDKVSTRETPGWFPSQQVQDYLRWATDETGHRFFHWAVLSNGNEWRLYCSDAAPDAYFAFSLAHGSHFCPLEEFRLFFSVFNPKAFERNEQGHCLLDAFREESLTHQLELETSLRRRVFDVLEELAEGFYKNPANNLAEADLPDVYDNSLVFLYRLLFVLYAESRGLLPVKTYGPRSNQRYRDEFSVTRFVDKLRDSGSFPDDAFDNFYREMLKLFHLVNGSRKDQNEKLGVTRYNGRLFSPDGHPQLERWWVGEKTLARVIRQLIFAQPPSRPTARQQAISTDETVDYSTLEVRQLGDIYEGLLGGKLVLAAGGHLELVNERGENKRQGIYYTPDWIVVYLVRQALTPLLCEIETRPEVQSALKARSTEKRQDNSFAYAVLELNVADPAMGSGHFLVRATEFLAQKIFDHPTTRRMTQQVVANGPSRRSREQIIADGLIPVPPGISQEQSEIAYWRRRVVEACIYGVDTNHLAVELTKLSLWLTCIAIDEPLNFLDHHLCPGNALLGSRPAELGRLPFLSQAQAEEAVFEIGDKLTDALREIIKENVSIEAKASTEMEIVKRKETQWKAVRAKMQPFLDVADTWLAAFDDLQVNHLDYRSIALAAFDPDKLTVAEKASARDLRESLAKSVSEKKKYLQPFHWPLEFPAVFYKPDGAPRPNDGCGFDAVLGNPPYVSTHTGAEEKWRAALKRRAGFAEDLYVHFTELAFGLLRRGGTVGFIVSDTFFTLASKLRMRSLIQQNELTHLGQCRPFDATVDAAILVARKRPMPMGDSTLFIQASFATDRSRPERELENLDASETLRVRGQTDNVGVRHASNGCLRLHQAPAKLYRDCVRQAFFEPLPAAVELYRRFNEPVKQLIATWWDRVDSFTAFSENLQAILKYQASLKPGDVTLVGLIAEGAQGMRTGNNGRFLGYLEGTPQAREIEIRRGRLTARWLGDPRVRSTLLGLLREGGGDARNPTANVPAWEACVEQLKAKFDPDKVLGFGRTDLYRVVSPELVVARHDFEFAWTRRKTQLVALWQSGTELKEFWEQRQRRLMGSQSEIATQETGKVDKGYLRTTENPPDDVFCRLCTDLVAWWERENGQRGRLRPKQPAIPRSSIGLRSGELYTNPADCPRTATIYNGLSGRAQWVPYRKGDPEGNRWLDNDPLFINWSAESVEWLSTSPSARWQGHTLFLTPGVTWTAVANHVAMKARYQDPCIFDADSMRLTTKEAVLDPFAFLALLNSNVLSYFKMKFIKHTQKWEIGDLRLLPIVMPTPGEERRLSELASHAMMAKKLSFSQEAPSDDLVSSVRELARHLIAKAPAYLRPSAQEQLLTTVDGCLKTIELAVNWEAEKLYGVEGLGPFDQF